jgi:hypothetical protein
MGGSDQRRSTASIEKFREGAEIMCVKFFLGLLIVLAVTSIAVAQQPAPSPKPAEPEPIADNSFLIEEAYNQEAGVVQHINTFMRMANGEWAYSFTQEWPVKSIKHQFSITAIGMQLGEGTDRHRGKGDMAFNYRYQLKGGDPSKLSISPRISLIVPTGSVTRGMGQGGYGVQTNLPISVSLSKKVVTHWNAGATYTISAKDVDKNKANTLGFNLGQSVIYMLSNRVNLMLETAWNSNQAVVGPKQKETSYSLFLNPGVRWSWNFKSGLQIVPGIAVPIGFGPTKGKHGLFFYLSFEHPFKKVADND